MPSKKTADDAPAKPPKRAAAAKTTPRAPRKTAAKRPAAKAATPKTARKPQAKRAVPAGKTARDYAAAKKAIGVLWKDLALETHMRFSKLTPKIENQFEQARQSIKDIDVKYALEKTGGKLKSVAKSGSAVAVKLGRQVKLLYMMLRDSTAGNFKAPWATISTVTAGLLYFVSPIDILPDFIPGIGLLDDALIIALVYSVARVDLRRYAIQNKLDLEDYGL